MANYDELYASYVSAVSGSADMRLAQLFDGGVYRTVYANTAAADRTPTLFAASGPVMGAPVYAFAQSSEYDGGAFDEAQAKKAAYVFEQALKNGTPVVGIYDSNGGYVADGAAALNGYSLVLEKASAVSGVVPVVSVIDGICSGSLALIALTADYVVMTEKAKLYLDVNTVYTAEDAAKIGLISDTAKDITDAIGKVHQFLTLMPANNMDGAPYLSEEAPAAVYSVDQGSFIGAVTDAESSLELYSDFGEDTSAALATVGGETVGVLSIGELNCKAMEKVVKTVRLCDAFNIPIISYIDSEKIDMSCHRAAMTFVRMSAAFSGATVPKIAVVKKAVGPVFTALAGANVSADLVIALKDAVISPIAPLTAAEFLYHDRLAGAEDTKAARDALAKEYAETQANAFEAVKSGAVHDIAAANELYDKISAHLAVLRTKRPILSVPKKHNTI